MCCFATVVTTVALCSVLQVMLHNICYSCCALYLLLQCMFCIRCGNSCCNSGFAIVIYNTCETTDAQTCG